MYSELQMKPNQHKCKIDNEKTLTTIINISTGRMSCLMQERKKKHSASWAHYATHS